MRTSVGRIAQAAGAAAITVRGRRQTARLDADHERAGRVAVLVEELVALRRTAAHVDGTRRLDALDAAARDLAAGHAAPR